MSHVSFFSLIFEQARNCCIFVYLINMVVEVQFHVSENDWRVLLVVFEDKLIEWQPKRKKV
jgi:hypothetical protein